ncbi:MAG: hypothetical protein ACHQ1D_12740 [Nitrososphaerales archaeon]
MTSYPQRNNWKKDFLLLKRLWAHRNCIPLYPTLRVYDLSQSSISQAVTVCCTEGGESCREFGNVDCTEISPGSAYVACQYDRKWWVELVKEKAE